MGTARPAPLGLLAAAALALAFLVALVLHDDAGRESLPLAATVPAVRAAKDASPVAPLGLDAARGPLHADSSPPAPEPADPLAARLADLPGVVTLTLAGQLIGPRGEPVADATLHFVPAEQIAFFLGWGRPPRHEPIRCDELPATRSDAAGRFRIDGPAQAPVGDLVDRHWNERTQLLVEHPGYEILVLEVPRTRGPHIDLGQVLLRDGVTLAGRVVDDHGRPVPDAAVTVLAPDDATAWSAGQGGPEHRAQRLGASRLAALGGPDGQFALESAWTGPALLLVSAAGFSREERRVAPVAAGRHEVGDLVLAAAPALAGCVVDARGAPIAGAEVVARPSALRPGTEPEWIVHELESRWEALIHREPETRTDAEGRFRFDRLPDEPHDLIAGSPLHEPIALRDLSGSHENLRVELADAARHLIRAVDGSGRPIPGARGVAKPLHPEDSEIVELEPLRTGREAAALAPDLPEAGLLVMTRAGRYGSELSLSAPGFAGLSVELPGLEPGEHAEHELRMEPEATIGGRVIGPAGAVAGALVELQMERAPVDNRVIVEVHEWRTRVDGRFLVTGLSAGHWEIRAAAAGLAPSAPVQYELGSGQAISGVEIRLLAGAALRGRVLDDATTLGRPHERDGASSEPTRAPDLVVTPHQEWLDNWPPPPPARPLVAWLFDADGGERSQHVADGSFLFEGLPPGSFRVGLASDGDLWFHGTIVAETAVRLAEGQELEIELATPPAGR